jgi:hypothetical protein
MRGGERQDELAIRMYVARKHPRSKIDRGALLPRRLATVMPNGARDRSRWISTDVEEVGSIVAATGNVSGGDEVRVAGRVTGTVGMAFVNRVDGRRYALTCGHVLDSVGATQIFTARGPVAADKVLRLPLDSSGRSVPHNIDGALARLPDGDGQDDLTIRAIGKRITGLADPGANDQMQLFSRVQGGGGKLVSANSLESPEATNRHGVFKVKLPGGAQPFLTDAFAVIIDAAQGDSGSLIVRDGAAGGVTVLGMLAAVDDLGRAYFQSIKQVLRQFGGDGVTPSLKLGLPGEM